MALDGKYALLVRCVLFSFSSIEAYAPLEYYLRCGTLSTWGYRGSLYLGRGFLRVQK